MRACRCSPPGCFGRTGGPFRSRRRTCAARSRTVFGGGAPATTARPPSRPRGGRPRRLTPLEARAIRLALEFVGPLIAAEAHRPLDRVRKKLEDTFGEFELSRRPELGAEQAEEQFVATLTDAIRQRRLVEIEYLKEEEGTPTTHLVEPYTIERRLPHSYVHTW